MTIRKHITEAIDDNQYALHLSLLLSSRMVIDLQTPEELKQDIFKNLQTLSKSTDPHTLLIAERLSSRLRELFIAEKMRSMETQIKSRFLFFSLSKKQQ